MVVEKPKGKQLLRTDIVREQGKLYYCGTDENGFIVVCESIMSRGGKRKKHK